MTDEKTVANIRALADKLNEALSAASLHGLVVKLDVSDDHCGRGEREGVCYYPDTHVHYQRLNIRARRPL